MALKVWVVGFQHDLRYLKVSKNTAVSTVFQLILRLPVTPVGQVRVGKLCSGKHQDKPESGIVGNKFIDLNRFITLDGALWRLAYTMRDSICPESRTTLACYQMLNVFQNKSKSP